MIYNFFGYPLKSNIEIPELGPANKQSCPVIDFILEDGLADNLGECNWFYQWKSDYGAVTISVARSSDNYVIEFPQLARFSLFSKKNVITCRRFDQVPGNTLRHLLLDQVLPRFI